MDEELMSRWEAALEAEAERADREYERMVERDLEEATPKRSASKG